MKRRDALFCWPALCLAMSLPAVSLAQENPFVGTWRGTSAVAGMIVTSEVTYLRDGQFFSVARNSQGYTVRVRGTYSFPTPGIIRYVNVEWVPPELKMPPDEHNEYQFISPTAVRIRSIVPGMPWAIIEKVH